MPRPALAVARARRAGGRPAARRRRATSSARKASTSSGVGGRPVRSNVDAADQRHAGRPRARARGPSPRASARMKRSIGFCGPGGVLDRGHVRSGCGGRTGAPPFRTAGGAAGAEQRRDGEQEQRRQPRGDEDGLRNERYYRDANGPEVARQVPIGEFPDASAVAFLLGVLGQFPAAEVMEGDLARLRAVLDAKRYCFVEAYSAGNSCAAMTSCPSTNMLSARPFTTRPSSLTSSPLRMASVPSVSRRGGSPCRWPGRPRSRPGRSSRGPPRSYTGDPSETTSTPQAMLRLAAWAATRQT